MGKLEFGRKGPEGLKGETDEKIIGSSYDEDHLLKGDGSEIKKILDGIDTSMDEDYSDCEKQPAESEEEKEESFEDCLKKATKKTPETAEEWKEYVEETEKIMENSKKELDDLKKSMEIFDNFR